jgi:hypothetical protein
MSALHHADIEPAQMKQHQILAHKRRHALVQRKLHFVSLESNVERCGIVAQMQQTLIKDKFVLRRQKIVNIKCNEAVMSTSHHQVRFSPFQFDACINTGCQQ